MTDTDLKARELELEYRGFLDDKSIYTAKVEQMIKEQNTRLIVNINDIRKTLEIRARGLIENSVEELVAFQHALKEFVITLNPSLRRSEFTIGLCGSFGSRHVTPRTLTSRFLNNTVCVEGIVSKISLVRPKIVKSVHYCSATKKTIERRHYDFSSLEYHPSSNVLELHDEDGNPVELLEGLSEYKDHQTVTLQEMPEVAPTGQLPRIVDVILQDDLVDKCKPGDRVQIVGSFRSLPNRQNGFTNCVFRTVVLANHVEQMSKEVSMSLTDDDVNACKRLSRSRRFNIFDRLAQSLAPTIYGYENVKKALLCLLLGGNEKILANGTRIRGDINVLLIGDPSVAKSQLLRFMLNCAPRAIPTTGRGSSGVGLTAAITMDPETGDRRLEAGAMVLADRGLVCIDEFDKMSDIDRTAIHEVMEQGRVTLCKAGMQVRLNARCSVLAAANPVCGNYDPYMLPMENIAMQDSLLSRFDLLFIMLDERNWDHDGKIADHVLRIHRYRPANELDGEPTQIVTNANYLTTFQEDPTDGQKMEVYERHNPLIHERGQREKYFTIDFLRKYIHIAKRVKPQLTEEVCFMIYTEYANLRKVDREVADVAKTQPITARTLETLIRLSTAHAKARLSTTVDQEDAAAAINLVQHSCYHKVLSKPKVQKRKKQPTEKGHSDGSDGGESEMDDDDDDESRPEGAPKSTSKRRRLAEAGDEGDAMEAEEDENAEFSKAREMSEEEKAAIKAQLPLFMDLINSISGKNQGAMTIDLDVVYSEAEKELNLEKSEVDILVLLMVQQDHIILDSNSIYLVT